MSKNPQPSDLNAQIDALRNIAKNLPAYGTRREAMIANLYAAVWKCGAALPSDFALRTEATLLAQADQE